jgi:2-polyprenyl-6-methoxyphenol hydroxylase-like FAD-dependent oxidoreductase
LAYWLNATGWNTSVVERFDGLRDTGQNIDVRGATREVVRRMGIEEALFAATSAADFDLPDFDPASHAGHVRMN